MTGFGNLESVVGADWVGADGAGAMDGVFGITMLF